MANVKLHKFFLFALLGTFIALTAWWAGLHLTGNVDNEFTHAFGATYGVIALVGGIYGLYAARNWGYFKSHLGRAVVFLSIGLLLQEFGQLMFSYYSYIEHIEAPYPSLADIGFFGAVPMYIIGAFFLTKGLGADVVIKKSPFKLAIGVIIPLIVLSVSYMLFLKDYDFTEKDSLTVLLDFGYPMGQAAFVSAALVILLALRGMLGGVMKMPVFLLLFAFIVQYAADFNFLYQVIQGTWTKSGIGYGDYLYLLAYFFMGASILALTHGFNKVFASVEAAKSKEST
jgi:hypothetical protein